MEDELMHFRTIFVVEPTHDISVLSKNCSQVVFLSKGDEKIETIAETMASKLLEFNPDEDALVPMGRVSACAIAGVLLSNRFRGDPRVVVMIGIYTGNKYIFIPLEVGDAKI
jgi:hypothetical protein